jgi:hypothetical protein
MRMCEKVVELSIPIHVSTPTSRGKMPNCFMLPPSYVTAVTRQARHRLA